ncbi:MAG: cytochrome c biogenesis protein CcdA/DsbC/DsbD-like thiol-disulfide interchange protein [Planctomycetota bacterium]|jgi:cytochrome c biogenesis protein CcdA/DsbC/DsbD-like thiol-disulfide interchange protein
MQRMRFLWTLLAILTLGLSATAQGDAQGKVKAELFTRVSGDAIEAVVRIDVAKSWHIYHTELGHPSAFGSPTRFTFSDEGITWGEAVMPEPEKHSQEELGEGIFILGHEGQVIVRAQGVLAAGASGSDVKVKVSGQICDPSMCLRFGFEVATKGAGSDKLFPAAAAPADVETEPVPSADEIEGGRADATLYTRVVGSEVHAAISVRMDRGYHLYADELGHPEAAAEPTLVDLNGAGVKWGSLHYPEAHRLDQGYPASDGSGEVWTWAYEDEVVFHMRGALEAGATGAGLWGEITGQTCDENGCINYRETIVSKGAGPDAYFAYFSEESTGEGAEAALAGSAGDKNKPARGGEQKDPWGKFLLLCIGGGLFTLLMPCTYPMIPITISFFTKQATARDGKVLPLSLAYGLGIVVIFTLIGAIIGPPIVAFSQHWISNLVIGTAFFLFAFSLFGLFTIQPPRFIMNLAGAAQGGSGTTGVFLMGATLVVTSFTCTAPIVGYILGVGAEGGDLVRVVIGMAVFGLTIAIPFVVLSLLPGRMASIPRAGQWMNTLKFYLGFVEIAAALKFFSNVDQSLNEGPRWLGFGVFMWLWAGIFGLAGLYLLGVVRFKDPKGPIGPVRMSFALLTLVFAGYVGITAWNGKVYEADTVLAGLAPPIPIYNWPVFKDDYDAAREQALAEDKLLFVNFTGHT